MPLDPNVKLTPEQKKQIDEMNAALDAQFERHNGHPIIKTALELCTTDEGLPWRKSLPPEALALLEQAVATCDKDGTITWATHGLIAVANYLDQEKAGKIAYDILNLANNTVVKYDLVARQKREKAEAARHHARTRKDAMSTMGLEQKVGAPKAGEPPPPGTVKGGALGSKRRI